MSVIIFIGGLGVQPWNWVDVHDGINRILPHCQLIDYPWPHMNKYAGRQIGSYPDLDGEISLLSEFIQHVTKGSEPVYLVAHSMASFLAEGYMFTHPHHLRGIIYVDGSVGQDWDKRWNILDRRIQDIASLCSRLIVSQLGMNMWQFFQMVQSRHRLSCLPRSREWRLLSHAPSRVAWETVAQWVMFRRFSRTTYQRRRQALHLSHPLFHADITHIVAESSDEAGSWYEKQKSMHEELKQLTSGHSDIRLTTQTEHMIMRHKPSIIVEAIADMVNRDS